MRKVLNFDVSSVYPFSPSWIIHSFGVIFKKSFLCPIQASKILFLKSFMVLHFNVNDPLWVNFYKWYNVSLKPLFFIWILKWNGFKYGFKYGAHIFSVTIVLYPQNCFASLLKIDHVCVDLFLYPLARSLMCTSVFSPAAKWLDYSGLQYSERLLFICWWEQDPLASTEWDGWMHSTQH